MTQRAREKFLEGLSKGLSITGACNFAALPRQTAYDWKKADPAFGLAWDDAIESGTDLIEDEARRRAVDGVEEPIVAMGRVAKNDDGTTLKVRKYSDTLMVQILKARRPDRYRERMSQEVTGPNGAPLPAERTVIILPSNGRD